MAGCEESQKVGPMDERRRVREREFVASWFVEQGLAKDEQETWIDFRKRLCGEFMMPLKKKVDKANLVAVESLDGERKRFKGAVSAAETAVDKIQTEKMDKTVEEVLDGEKNGFSTITSGAPAETGKVAFCMQTEKMDKCADSDPPAGVNGKHRVDDDYVTMVLAMPREIPMDTEDLSFYDDLAKLMDRGEDWIEERKKNYLERAALSKRINEEFVQFQESMRDEWLTKGYVEADDDFDYDEREAMVEKFHRDLWAGTVESTSTSLA